MSDLYHGGSRALQDRFDTRRLADRIEERLVDERIGPEDKVFIEARDMFFLATADGEGQPSCSYKGGDPVSCAWSIQSRSPFRTTTATACSCRRGTWRRTGASACCSSTLPAEAAAHLGRGERAFRRSVAARVSASPVHRARRGEPGLPNCPRYIHRYALVERSSFVPKAGCPTPIPGWKKSDWAKDILPSAIPRASRNPG